MPHANKDLSFELEASFKSFEIDNVPLWGLEPDLIRMRVLYLLSYCETKHLTEFQEYFGFVLHIGIVSNGKTCWKKKKKALDDQTSTLQQFKMWKTYYLSPAAHKHAKTALRNQFVMLGNHWSTYSSKSNSWRSVPSREGSGRRFIFFGLTWPQKHEARYGDAKPLPCHFRTSDWLSVLSSNCNVTVTLPNSNQSGTEGGRSQSKEAEFCRHGHIRNFTIWSRTEPTTSKSRGGRSTASITTEWTCQIRTE